MQVCDDSTREDVRRRIDDKATEMCHRGHNCIVTRRDANKGFKVPVAVAQYSRGSAAAVSSQTRTHPCHVSSCLLWLHGDQTVVMLLFCYCRRATC